MHSGTAGTRAIQKAPFLRRNAVALGIVLALCAVALPFGPVEEARAARSLVAKKSSSGALRWSSPKTWGGTVPRSGDEVTIPHGTTVKLNESTPALSGLEINGALRFARKRLSLTSDWIMVHGTLRIGSEKRPFRNRAVITLTGSDKTQSVMGMGTKVLGVMGGRLEMHGRRTRGWTKLANTAAPGHSAITLKKEMKWRPGDKIVIASTDYWHEHAEVRKITDVSGKKITLDSPLSWEHYGELQSYGDKVLDERAEVGLLSRNVLVRGDASSPEKNFGGHLMVMGGLAKIEGAEFYNMGQLGMLGRYPVHFHMNGSMAESYVKKSSIHRSFQRCVVIHGTHHLEVRDNVCYDHFGHGYFFEDGGEHDNVMEGNLGLGTKETDDGLLPTDRRPATFWITNPDNVIKNNVAAGSDRMGFWYALPEHPTGPSYRTDVWPQRIPLKKFSGNVSHSNSDMGLHIDHGPDRDGNIDVTWYEPVIDPSDPDSAPVVARFENYTAYKNRNNGIWSRGANHVFTGAVLADNQGGATFASVRSFLEDSLVVGESDNAGNAERWETTGYQGRPLPMPWEPDHPIVGFEFYDGLVGVRRTTFSGFHTNPVRSAGALSSKLENDFPIDPKNFSEGVRFLDTNKVYLADPLVGADGTLSQVSIDRDGSVTGIPGAALVADNPFLLKPDCVAKPNWNAHVCPSPSYASLSVGALDGKPSQLKPVTLTRTDGVKQTLMGCCDDSHEAWSTVIGESSYEVAYNGGTPKRTRFILANSTNHWVHVVLPVPGDFKVMRWSTRLTSVESLDALAKKTQSAFYYDPATSKVHLRLWGVDDYEELRVELL